MKRVKSLLIVVVFLVSLGSLLSGCAAVLLGEAAYGGAAFVKERYEISNKEDCVERGMTWVKGNALVFKSGKCIAKRAGRVE